MNSSLVWSHTRWYLWQATISAATGGRLWGHDLVNAEAVVSHSDVKRVAESVKSVFIDTGNASENVAPEAGDVADDAVIEAGISSRQRRIFCRLEILFYEF